MGLTMRLILAIIKLSSKLIAILIIASIFYKSRVFVFNWIGGELTINLQEQTQKALQMVGIPITVFCNRMSISTAAYYRWQHNDLKLSTKTEERIKKYVNKLSEVF